jgi:hypothetical protein
MEEENIAAGKKGAEEIHTLEFFRTVVDAELSRDRNDVVTGSTALDADTRRTCVDQEAEDDVDQEAEDDAADDGEGPDGVDGSGAAGARDSAGGDKDYDSEEENGKDKEDLEMDEEEEEIVAAPKRSRGALHGARFSAEIYTRGCHWIPRMFA